MRKNQEYNYSVSGMNCSACASRVEKAALGATGVRTASVSLLTNTICVTGEFDEAELFTEVKKAGYGITYKTECNYGSQHKSEADRIRTRLLISLCFLFPLMYISMGDMLSLPLPAGITAKKIMTVFQFVFALAVIIMNRITFIRAFNGVLKLDFNMDTLVSLGSLASFGVSVYGLINILCSVAPEQAASYNSYIYFDSSAMVLTLINIGKMLEERAKIKTTSALDSLKNLQPKTVTLVNGDVITYEKLTPGDIFIVKAGEAIGTDGTVTEGNGAVNESMVTGESIPKDVRPGSGVIGGTILSEGYVKVKASVVGDGTMLSEIIKEVESAGLTKAPVGRIADKVSGYFAGIVMGISLITFVVWILLGSGWDRALIYAASVLVVSCPCALGLATPVAVTVGLGCLAKKGILIKNAAALEDCSRITMIDLDKTGTLTTGKMQLAGIIGDKSILPEFKSLETCSQHPLSVAITSSVSGETYEVKNYKRLDGGIEGEINGEKYTAGNLSVAAVTDKELIAEAENNAEEIGGTAVYFTGNGKSLAAILTDTVKSGADEFIRKVKEMGIKTCLLTGDGKTAALSVSSFLKTDGMHYSLKPKDKADIIAVQQKEEKVCFVGDGINDAVALEKADVGVALGAAEVAVNSADVVILSSEPLKVSQLMAVAKKSSVIIKENLFWAFLYNAVCIPVAAGALSPFGIIITPMMGSLAMSISSLCVVMNSLRIGLEKNKKGNKNMKTVVIKGMMCEHCVKHVKDAFTAAGISAEIDLKKGQAMVSDDTDDEKIKEIVTGAGYEFVKIK